MLRSLYLLFFLSGVSGLVYQILWVRQFGNLFGNTIHSAALVTSVFMLGLGVGSYVWGRYSDRRCKDDPQLNVKLYGYLEIVIAILGLLVATAFFFIEALSSSLSSYVVGDNGWQYLSTGSYLFRYCLAFFLMAPITFLMGGTLPLLIRYSLHNNLTESAWRVGGLYGINTLGAAFGALIVDFFLVPAIGIFASQGVAIILNVVAGIGALRLIRNNSNTEASVQQKVPPTQSKEEAPLLSTFVAIFTAGFLGMGLEIIWYRFLTGTVGSYRMVFSLLLFIILMGIWAGSLLGGHLVRKGFSARKCFLFSQIGILLVGFLSLFFYTSSWAETQWLKDLFLASPPSLGLFIEIFYQMKILFLVAFLPSVFMGVSYPVANALIQSLQGQIGRRAGALYFANTFGGVLGSLVAGFFLIPHLGIQQGLGVVFLVGCIGIFFLVHTRPSKFNWGLATLAFGVAITWFFLPSQFLVKKMFTKAESSNAKYMKITEGINEVVAVARGEEDELLLLTNGHKMSGTSVGDQRYMGAFTHIPLLQIKAPKSALVICFGVGNTVYSASLHPTIENLHIVDLSENVVNHAHYFHEFNQGVLKDPRVKIHINDGRQHLRMKKDLRYDLITLEPPPLPYAGVTALYSKEFYELAYKNLKVGGYLTQWLPINQIPEEVTLSLIKAFIDVFPNTVLLNGYYNSLMLMGRKEAPIEFDPGLFNELLAERPGVQAHMKKITLNNLLEVVGSFVSDKSHLKEVTKNVIPMSDNRPMMEYSHIAFLNHSIPKEIFKLESYGLWCEECVLPTWSVGELTDLNTYFSILRAWYSTEQYLYYSNIKNISKAPINIPKSAGNVPKVIRGSSYLQYLFEKK